MTTQWINGQPDHDHLINEFMVKTTSSCRHGGEIRIKRIRPKSKSNLTILKQTKPDSPTNIQP